MFVQKMILLLQLLNLALRFLNLKRSGTEHLLINLKRSLLQLSHPELELLVFTHHLSILFYHLTYLRSVRLLKFLRRIMRKLRQILNVHLTELIFWKWVIWEILDHFHYFWLLQLRLCLLSWLSLSFKTVSQLIYLTVNLIRHKNWRGTLLYVNKYF